MVQAGPSSPICTLDGVASVFIDVCLEGRQYGRGKTGGQVRDEYRTDYDPGRGGYGKRNEDAANRKR